MKAVTSFLLLGFLLFGHKKVSDPTSSPHISTYTSNSLQVVVVATRGVPSDR